jgi:hypothetical protein
MNEDDFAELRSALHARDLHLLHTFIPRLTPEYERYARDHLDTWTTGTHWDLGDGLNTSAIASLRVEGAQNPLTARRTLRVTLATREVWYEREVFAIDATRPVARLACDLAGELMEEAGVTEQASWDLLEAQRRWLEGEAPRDEVRRARGRADRSWRRVTPPLATTSELLQWAAIGVSEEVAARAFHQARVAQSMLHSDDSLFGDLLDQSFGGIARVTSRLLRGSLSGAVRETSRTLRDLTADLSRRLEGMSADHGAYEKRLEDAVLEAL